MQQITAPELAQWLGDAGRESPLLLDVREPGEFAIGHIAQAQLVPMRTIPARFQDLNPEAQIVCICLHGARSYQVAMFLEHQGFSRVFNLSGGMHAWSTQVDPSIPTY